MSHNTNNDFPYSDDGSNSSINQNNFCFNDFSTYNLYNYFQDYSSSKNIQDVVTLWDKNNKEEEPYLPNDNNNNSINRDNLDINNNFKEDIKHFNNDNESEESKEDKSSKRNDEKALFKLDYLMPTMNQTQKNKKERWKYLGFVFAVIWVLILGYNRIHMNAHFLTDVCFGILITYSIYALTYRFVFSALSPVPVDTESAE